MSDNRYGTVDARPVKRFFVEMLTRDLDVEDAVLDLLDNCVDGILRSARSDMAQETPYSDFWARITVSKDLFEIEDNCGGIPWHERDRAFRMGRPIDATPNTNDEAPLSVGVYGIGMKRAIFKIGSDALISTQNNGDRYQVPITAPWMSDESDWGLEVKPVDRIMDEDGTKITIRGLHSGISEQFAAEAFTDNLLDKIEGHYAVIIRKGLRVEVNGIEANPKPIHMRFATDKSDGNEVRPYIFRSKYDGVDVFLAVGLREPILDAEKTFEEQTEVQFSSEEAGWTVICNDRVVLYCNRDEMTGWGTLGIPRYHTQFIAISGVVEFRGDPSRLPTTTTKRGLNFSSPLYQQVLNRMREGLRIFVDFTNKWKARAEDAKAHVAPVPAISYSEIKERVETLKFNSVARGGLEGEQYRPRLPLPPDNTTDMRISYFREQKLIASLAEKLLPDIENPEGKDVPRKVGEASFEFAYNHLVKHE